MDVVDPFIKSNKARMVEFLDELSVSRTMFETVKNLDLALLQALRKHVHAIHRTCFGC